MIEEINVKGNKLYIVPRERRLFENQVCCDDCMCDELIGGCDYCPFENDEKIYNCDERITRSNEKLVMVELEHEIWGLLNKTYNQALKYKIDCRDIYCSDLENDCNKCCFQNEDYNLEELNYKLLD